jgi:hypothetical protein
MVTKALIIAMLLLAGCATPEGGSFCDVSEPNRDPIEDMTPAEARRALSHNLKGARLCGWKA